MVRPVLKISPVACFFAGSAASTSTLKPMLEIM